MDPALQDKYDKSFASLRAWMLGRQYYMAVRALQFMRDHHTGLRKDGFTPYEIHPLMVTQYIRTLIESVMYPEVTLAAALLHDTVEDSGVTLPDIQRKFGEKVSHSVNLLSKVVGAIRKPGEAYYQMMESDAPASLVKGADRVHNIQSMVGVFSRTKQVEYMDETRTRVLPLLKQGRRNFPEQYNAYENMKLVLVSQMELLEHIHAAGVRE